MSEKKQHRTVLITGAAGGVGRATVQAFADAGWSVIGVDRAAFQNLAIQEERVFPANGLYIQADISAPENMENIFAQARAFTPKLDALVNNAALQICKPLVETTVEEWDAVMNSNLRSTFLGAKLAFPLLKAAGESAIVIVSSVHAVQTSANIAAYAASKGGLLALTRAMAIEFAPDNIRVNAILPGGGYPYATRRPVAWSVTAAPSRPSGELARKTVNGRVGQPSEIATPSTSWRQHTVILCHRQALIIDGGATARLSTE